MLQTLRPCVQSCLKYRQTLLKNPSVRQSSKRKCSSSSHESFQHSNPLLRYLRSLKWVPIPVGVGFAYIAYQHYGHVAKREKQILQSPKPADRVAREWQVNVYRALPFKFLSRSWGKVNDLELPTWLRSPLFKAYIKCFGCNMEEAAIQDLTYYKNLGAFFRRRLKPNCRPVDAMACVTSPSDGKVLHLGRTDNGCVEQVKGITYSLDGFLGPPPVGLKDSPDISKSDGVLIDQHLKHKEDNELFHCVVYLAPGDYHGFHSPADWTVVLGRHFPGDLLSVSPFIARQVQGLFNYNERAVYMGRWEHGFFAMAAVGATNVGSIKVYHDQFLMTNRPVKHKAGSYYDRLFSASDRPGIPMNKGDPFGEFNLGSTIVLVFEAPKTFRFQVKPGQKVKYGESLGCLTEKVSSS